MKYFFGIDTSNYTTSAVVCDENGEVIKNIRIPLKVNDGEHGLRQNDAVFGHIKNIPKVMEEIGRTDLTALGYSAYPRDSEGSYMPCFLAGEAIANSIASINGLPVYNFSHQAGHIAAAKYSSKLNADKFIAFHVSGGTTEVLYVECEKINKLGGTLDLNAGQIIDRIGVKLNLKFPCGAELENLANTCDKTIKVNICVKDCDCNFSGLENQAIELIKNGFDNNYVAAYVIEFIKATIDKLTYNALQKHSNLPVLYAGGVMSNQIIKNYLSNKYKSCFASPEFSADNAAGIAILCRQRYLNGK